MNAMHGVMVAAALVLGCSSDGGTGPCGRGGTATSVGVCDNFFAPASSPITAGAAVTWTWRGGNGHNVTFEDGQGSSATQTSGTHSRPFSAAGTFRYRCTIHSSGFDPGPGQMAGSVTVQ
jgi:plastocyanin